MYSYFRSTVVIAPVDRREILRKRSRKNLRKFINHIESNGVICLELEIIKTIQSAPNIL